MRKKFIVGGFQVFRVNFGFPQHGHEIGVACPSGNDVAMNVLVIPRTSRFTDIISNIKTIRINHRTQYLDTFVGQLVQFRAFVSILLGQTPDMTKGRYH